MHCKHGFYYVHPRGVVWNDKLQCWQAEFRGPSGKKQIVRGNDPFDVAHERRRIQTSKPYRVTAYKGTGIPEHDDPLHGLYELLPKGRAEE